MPARAVGLAGMKWRQLAASGAAMLLLGAAPAPAYDIVIRGGRVLDGAGNPWVRADIGIKDGRIAKIGHITARGAKEIDATGRYVAPGFIDMMDQSGSVLLKHGAAENKLRMGVTTLIGGEGGTPVAADAIPRYFDDLATRGIAVNFGTYYSATQARVAVMGDGAGAPTPAQLDAMRGLVDRAMQAGAFGISTALMYPPDRFHATEDLVALAKVAAGCGGFYATHMRDESARLLDSVDEAIRIGEDSGAKVEIFHLKAAYAPGWGTLMPQAIARIAAARERGVDVAADLYPYTAAGTGLEGTVPGHVFAQGFEAGLAKLRDPALRAALKRDAAAGSVPGWSSLVEAAGGWQNIVLANSHQPDMLRFHGKNFVEIGAALNKDPADAAWDMLLGALPNRAFALYFVMDERDIDAAIRQPWISIGSDGAAAAVLGELDGMGLPHPRSYGTFARVLAAYVRERGVLSLEEAVRKMTSWPAQRMGLSDRGLLREGLRADMVIFDAATVEDHASWTAPMRPATGIADVIVNGVLTLDQGRHTGARAGMVLRHQCGR